MRTKKCDETRMKNLDVKEKMAILLINHNLLGDGWEDFHKDVHKIIDKYWDTYERGLKHWFKTGEMNNNI